MPSHMLAAYSEIPRLVSSLQKLVPDARIFEMALFACSERQAHRNVSLLPVSRQAFPLVLAIVENSQQLVTILLSALLGTSRVTSTL